MLKILWNSGDRLFPLISAGLLTLTAIVGQSSASVAKPSVNTEPASEKVIPDPLFTTEDELQWNASSNPFDQVPSVSQLENGKSNENFAGTEDFTTIENLQKQFTNELADLQDRVNSLEARAATVEQHQFSTTTKLRGDVFFIVSDAVGDRAVNPSIPNTTDDANPFSAYYALLRFMTSFNGRDQLTVNFISANTPLLAFSTGTNMTNFVFDPPSYQNTLSAIDRLNYRFPVGKKATVWIGAAGLQPFDYFPTLNPLITSPLGPVSRFSWFNPAVYRLGFSATGIGFAYRLNQQVQFHASYLSSTGQATNPLIGLFQGNHAIISQVTFTPTPQFGIGITFTHKYFTPGTVNLQGFVGSQFSLTPFQQNATTSDNFGLQFNWRMSPRWSVGGWVGYTLANQSNGDGKATIVNGAFNLVFPDLIKAGNLGGFIIGIPPKVTSNNYQVAGVLREDRNTSFHLETFYTIRLTNNLSLTPNLYLITSPEHNNDNDLIMVGAIRTNFGF